MTLRPSIPLLSATALVAVSVGLSAGFWSGLALVSVGMLAVLGAAAVGHGGGDDGARHRGRAAARSLLAVALVAFCVWHVLMPPGIYLRPPQPPAFRALAVAAAIAAATYLVALPHRLARWRLLLVVALFAAMGVVTIRASPEPYIDVW